MVLSAVDFEQGGRRGRGNGRWRVRFLERRVAKRGVRRRATLGLMPSQSIGRVRHLAELSVRIGVALVGLLLQTSNRQGVADEHQCARHAEADDRAEDDERAVAQYAVASVFVDDDQNVRLVGEAENENGARDGDGERPDGDDGEKGLAFAAFAAPERTRDVKEAIDGDDRQVPDRCRAQENVEEDVEIAHENGQLPRAYVPRRRLPFITPADVRRTHYRTFLMRENSQVTVLSLFRSTSDVALR